MIENSTAEEIMKNETQEIAQKEVLTQFVTSLTIKYLFSRFHARYGSRWVSQFPDDLWPMVQKEWLDELSEMTPDDIKRGLDTWRDSWPPNVFEFSEACRPYAQENKACFLEYAPVAKIKTSPEDAKNNIKNLKDAISGSRILDINQKNRKEINKNDDYMKIKKSMDEEVKNSE